VCSSDLERAKAKKIGSYAHGAVFEFLIGRFSAGMAIEQDKTRDALGVAQRGGQRDHAADRKSCPNCPLDPEMIEHGDDFQEALEYARNLAADEKLTFVPSFDVSLVSGVASYGLELFSAAPELDAVYVPIGLGSGICGTIAARDALGCKADVIGVVSERAAAYALSFERGHAVSTNSADTLADGMACRVPDEQALAEILAHVSRIVTVSDDAIVDAMRYYFSDTHNLAEGAGAAPLAALLSEKERMAGKSVGLILSGGNVDTALYQRVIGGLGGESPAA